MINIIFPDEIQKKVNFSQGWFFDDETNRKWLQDISQEKNRTEKEQYNMIDGLKGKLDNKYLLQNIFAKNLELTNNKENIIESCSYVWNNNLELQKIGNKEEYTAYETLIDLGKLPNQYWEYHTNSKVRNIVWHGTRNKNRFNEFDKKFLGTSNHVRSEKDVEGFFFTEKFDDLWHYSQFYNEEMKWIDVGQNYAILLNINNPYLESDWKIFQKGKRIIWTDGTIFQFPWLRWYPKLYLVFEPNQIHILWSKQDVKGFKEWKNRN